MSGPLKTGGYTIFLQKHSTLIILKNPNWGYIKALLIQKIYCVQYLMDHIINRDQFGFSRTSSV
jgi:hypothetical protein